MKADDQAGHSRRHLILAVLQYLKERFAQSARASPDGDALFDQEGSYLIDRVCPARHQARSNTVTGLQVELILGLLLDRAQIWPQDRLCDRFSVVVIVLLPNLRTVQEKTQDQLDL